MDFQGKMIKKSPKTGKKGDSVHVHSRSERSFCFIMASNEQSEGNKELKRAKEIECACIKPFWLEVRYAAFAVPLY